MHESSTWVGKVQLLLAKGEVEQAFAAFKIVLEGDGDNVPAFLGQACVEFNRGRYSDSLEQAFQRVLELDSENVEALVALAIMDLQANDAAGNEKGMDKMRRAFEIYPYCAMALNYLAYHFFFTGQHFLVEQLTETALRVTDHGPTKSHSFYNLARSYHSKVDFEKAGYYYMASIKEINKPVEFVFPYYGLAQVKLEAAFDTFKKATNLLEKGGQAVPVEVLNNIGVLHFEREELELALESFNKALGDGVWLALTVNKPKSYVIEASASILDYKDMQVFRRLEEDEYPYYIDAYLRLAAIEKARNNLQLSIELVNEALKVNGKCPNALSMLGDLELKNDDWVKAKETLRSASDATNGKDSYAILSLGNWNYFAANRNEKRNPKLEARHLEKAKELYTRVLVQHTDNLYAANCAGEVLAEKGQFDVSKDIFTQVQEGASGSVFVQMADLWINLAYIFFAQGNFALALGLIMKLNNGKNARKLYLRDIHLAPSNYTLRFDAGVAMQKLSTSILQKDKRTADEVRSAVAELENAVRMFSQLFAASNLLLHGFDEKKINTHVEYCKHLLEAAKVHREAAEHDERQSRQKQEAARQLALAEEARRKAEEQRKYLLERRKQEDEQKRLQQAEEHFKRMKDQCKSSSNPSRRRDRPAIDDEEGGHSEKRRRKGGKGRRNDKNK
ncbi:Protein CTR9-like protein [Hibiscus syriacus]|uniref:Protein CTR9-like protein n=1 Tax=Hibiscus syriacus TaxID=106335 RepID=A0A6A3BF63_HIBSY|nr:Protein CTR9-like protein [Hibiscus syriacus]